MSVQNNTKFFDFVLYARVSTDDQDLHAQELQIKQFFENRPNFRIVGVYTDYSSAYNGVPPNFEKMLTEIEKIPHNTRPNIVVTSVDRFSRNFTNGTNFLNKIIALGTEILFINNPTMNVRSVEGRNWFNEELKTAEKYSQILSEKVKNAYQARKNACLATSHTPSFGTLHFKGTDGRTYVEPNPDEEMVQGLIALMATNCTFKQVNDCLHYYLSEFGTPDESLSLIGNYCDEDDENEVFQGNDENIAGILNYFGIYKRGEKWTKNSVKYQWTSVIKDSSSDEDKVSDRWLSYIDETFFENGSTRSSDYSSDFYTEDDTTSVDVD